MALSQNNDVKGEERNSSGKEGELALRDIEERERI